MLVDLDDLATGHQEGKPRRQQLHQPREVVPVRGQHIEGGPRVRSSTLLPEAMKTVLGIDGPISVFADDNHMMGSMTAKSLLAKIAQGARHV